MITVNACQSEKSEAIQVISQKGELQYTIDTIQVSIDERTSYLYNRFNTFESADGFFLVTYNQLIHTLQFFDLKSQSLSKSIRLQRGGENGVNDIQNLYVHNLDSIFIFDSGNMKIINDRSKVIYRINLFESVPDPMRLSFADFISKPFFDSQRKSVYFRNAHGRRSEEELLKPFLVALDIRTREFRELEFNHPQFFLDKKGLFGPYDQVSITHVDNGSVVYNYQVESSLFKQSLDEAEAVRFDGMVNSIDNLANTFTSSQNLTDVTKYRYETAQFYNVLHDPYRQLYYRVHRTGKPFDPSDRNVLRNTTFYISVFDRNLKFIKEIELDTNVYTQYSWFVSPQGLCINAAFPDYDFLDENKMIIHAYNFYFKP